LRDKKISSKGDSPKTHEDKQAKNSGAKKSAPQEFCDKLIFSCVSEKPP
jgi:hypothetical protein